MLLWLPILGLSILLRILLRGLLVWLLLRVLILLVLCVWLWSGAILSSRVSCWCICCRRVTHTAWGCMHGHALPVCCLRTIRYYVRLLVTVWGTICWLLACV